MINSLKNKTLPYILGGALALSSLTGCDDTRKEISDVLHEDAIVSTKIYSPSEHKTDLELKAFNLAGKGFGSVGVSYGGSIGIGVGNGLQISSSDVPEKYGAVFKCKHGSFTSQGSDQRHKDLYNKLKDGQEVDVTYKEIYRTTYRDINKDGKKELIQKVLIDFDFLDANPKK